MFLVFSCFFHLFKQTFSQRIHDSRRAATPQEFVCLGWQQRAVEKAATFRFFNICVEVDREFGTTAAHVGILAWSILDFSPWPLELGVSFNLKYMLSLEFGKCWMMFLESLNIDSSEIPNFLILGLFYPKCIT